MFRTFYYRKQKFEKFQLFEKICFENTPPIKKDISQKLISGGMWY